MTTQERLAELSYNTLTNCGYVGDLADELNIFYPNSLTSEYSEYGYVSLKDVKERWVMGRINNGKIEIGRAYGFWPGNRSVGFEHKQFSIPLPPDAEIRWEMCLED